MSNAHFAKLFKEYHELDHEVLRIEEGVETPTDNFLEGRKKKRLNLKDKLLKMLTDYRKASEKTG